MLVRCSVSEVLSVSAILCMRCTILWVYSHLLGCGTWEERWVWNSSCCSVFGQQICNNVFLFFIGEMGQRQVRNASISVSQSHLFVVVGRNVHQGRLWLALLEIYRIDFIELICLFDYVPVVLIALAEIVFLDGFRIDRLLMFLGQSLRECFAAFFGDVAAFEFDFFLFVFECFLADKLDFEVFLAKILKCFGQFLLVGVDADLSCFCVFGDILSYFFDAFLVYFGIVFVEVDESCEAVLSFEYIDLFMNDFDLFSDELIDVDCFFPVVDLLLFVLAESVAHDLFFKGLEEQVDFFEDFLLIFQKLIVDTFPQAHDIVVYFIVCFVKLLEHDDVLVAFLLCVGQGFAEVDVGGFVVFEEVLFGVLDDAVGTERHEAFGVAAEVGEELVGVVGAEYFFDFLLLGQGGVVLNSGHGRYCQLLYHKKMASSVFLENV